MRLSAKTFFLIASLSLFSPFSNAKWVIHNISTDHEMFFYYDDESLESANGIIKVKELVNYPDTRSRVRSVILTKQYDCQNSASRFTQMDSYSGYMGSGDLLTQENRDQASWKRVSRARSISLNILSILCGFSSYSKEFIESYAKSCKEAQKVGASNMRLEFSDQVISDYCTCAARYIYAAVGEERIREVELGLRQVADITSMSELAGRYCANQITY